MFSNTVKALLATHGEDVILTTKGTITRTGTARSETHNTQTIKMASIAAKISNPREVASVIAESVRHVIISGIGLDYAPHKNAKITTAEGTEYNILDLEAKKHGNSVVAYILMLQGGANG